MLSNSTDLIKGEMLKTVDICEASPYPDLLFTALRLETAPERDQVSLFRTSYESIVLPPA